MYEGWFDEAVLAPSGSQVTLTEAASKGEEEVGEGGGGGGGGCHPPQVSSLSFVRVVQSLEICKPKETKLTFGRDGVRTDTAERKGAPDKRGHPVTDMRARGVAAPIYI